jgi:hypothetical protein
MMILDISVTWIMANRHTIVECYVRPPLHEFRLKDTEFVEKALDRLILKRPLESSSSKSLNDGIKQCQED